MVLGASIRWFSGTSATSHGIVSGLPRPNDLSNVLNLSDDQIPVKEQPADNSPSKSTMEVKEKRNLQDYSYLNAVVKVFIAHTKPSYSLPWQKEEQCTSCGSAFVIGHGKLLTNAHCVEHATRVSVKRRDKKTIYIAKVLAKGIECDIALLSVENEEFWQGIEPLRLGCMPNMQDSVTVVGYPLGGKIMSMTKGIVSRIEVTSYCHSSCKLFGIQIDAAINGGNSGGPALNDKGECIGIAFQGIDKAQNIGCIIPTTVVSHFLEDYERNGKYTGFPSIGAVFQKLENPYLRAMLKVSSNEGVLVKTVDPTSSAHKVLKKGDVVVSFDNVPIACDGTVPFRSSESIAFRYLVSQKFTGDEAEIGIIRGGQLMEKKVILNPPVYLVPNHIDEREPSYLIVGGMVFTPRTQPLLDEFYGDKDEDEDDIGSKKKKKTRDFPAFEGQQIVVLSQILANEVNIGYKDRGDGEVLKLNETWINNIYHLAQLVDSCKDKYFVFEFDDGSLVVLEREPALAASKSILKDHGVPSERSKDLLQPCDDVNSIEEPPISYSNFLLGLISFPGRCLHRHVEYLADQIRTWLET